MIEQPEEALVGQVVEGRYRIEAQIGRGAMGVVYRARHVKVGREVAIKVLHDHLVRDTAMVARFEREAAIAASLHHRNLVHVIDVGETASRRRLMVLELVRGESLAALMADGPLAGDRVIRLVRQLLQGLEHAHAAGLVHRDLKPENVLVERDSDGAEVPRIVDFGIAVPSEAGGGAAAAAAAAARRITETGVVLGTPSYMAPEQAHGEAPDPRTDLFALGVMTYEMLSGRSPFDGTGVEVILANLSKDPPLIHRRAPGVVVDPLLEAFTRRLMARELAARFPSARAALDALDEIERDREGAAARFGLVTDADFIDTAPTHVTPAIRALARPTVARAAPEPPAASEVPPPPEAPAVSRETQPSSPFSVPAPAAVPQPPPVPVLAPAPRREPPPLPLPMRWRPLLGCAVFLAAGAFAFALVA